MANTKITAESFLDSKELREQAMSKIEVLEKVKQLFLIPELECMTVKQVADYFEVDSDTIKKQYQRNQDEFDSDGTHTKSLLDFKNLNGTKCPIKKMAQQNGKLAITFNDNTELIIPNRGIKCFPKRAILRMGMLLRDSRVAREIRDQLLNTFEHATEEQRVTEIKNEQQLRDAIWDAWSSNNIDDVMKASAALDGYRRRYITQLEHHNTELAQKNENLNNEIGQKDVIIKESKPKVEFYDIVADTKELTDMAQFTKTIYEKSGIRMGRNRLYRWLRDEGYLRDNNEPYQQYVTAGYFVMKMIWVNIGGLPEPKPKTFLTGKGQQYILAKLKEAFPKVAINRK